MYLKTDQCDELIPLDWTVNKWSFDKLLAAEKETVELDFYTYLSGILSIILATMVLCSHFFIFKNDTEDKRD